MTKLHTVSLCSLLSVVVSVAACDDGLGGPRLRTDDAGPTPMTDAGPGGTTDTGGGVARWTPPPDPGPLPPDPMIDAVDRTRAASCPATSDWVVATRGRVIDERGMPIAGALILPCLLMADGRRLCLRPSRTDAAGITSTILAEENRCVNEVALRVLVPDSAYAAGYCLPAGRSVDGVLAPRLPLVLATTTRPASRPPTGDQNAMREVTFDGMSMRTSPSAIGVPEYETMGIRFMDGAFATGSCLGDGTPMDLLIGFAPEAAVSVTEGLSARIQARGFSPGTSLDLFMLGGLTPNLADGTEVREGEWHQFATVTVAADGTIETPAGHGVPHLSWLGLRRAR